MVQISSKISTNFIRPIPGPNQTTINVHKTVLYPKIYNAQKITKMPFFFFPKQAQQ
jgi:hypothetical protein